MVFSSPLFLFLFLPCVLVLSFLVKASWRNLILLLASLLFYAWGEPVYILLLLASIVLNYLFGLLIAKAGAKKLVTLAGVFANLAILLVFKYLNFFTGAFASVVPDASAFQTNIALPLGISFYTFQGISYIIDVYRNNKIAEKSLLNVATYIAMFPQLVAGPIVRFETVAAQLAERTENISRARLGAILFIIGLSQKVVFADNFAFVADRAFDGDIEALSVLDAWIGAISYSLQIFYDFAGYSNMAIGLGVIFGFTFPKNFEFPYASRSITEFWRRWHMSLSSWFRDYLYIPLGGNRHGSVRTYVNLFTVFFLCGLWHGASWAFVFWGVLHGVYLVIERAGFKRVLEAMPAIFQHLYTLLLVQIAWIFFRAETFGEAFSYLAAMFGAGGEASSTLYLEVSNVKYLVLFVLAAIFATPLSEMVERIYGDWRERIHNGEKVLTPKAGYGAVLGVLEVLMLVALVIALVAVATNAYSPFIYFRF